MTLIEGVLLLLTLGLFLWVFQLRQQMRELLREKESQPEIQKTLTARDVEILQNTLADLVSNIEYYTESQLQRINLQSEAVRTISRRVTERLEIAQASLNETLAERNEEAPPVVPVQPTTTARITPLPPRELGGKHRDKDRIIELHRQGWQTDQIAKELRLNKGEVQLIVNLA
ncbi:MAG: hypothetical protein P9L94_02895 [Candidatus Hinthialibacter antarcticus]|nr:hypothetical protein [Candidatus Hinthialibacter antarcticus]